MLPPPTTDELVALPVVPRTCPDGAVLPYTGDPMTLFASEPVLPAA